MTTRRHVLGTLSFLGAAALAGCLTTYTAGEEETGGDGGQNGNGGGLPGGDDDGDGGDSGETRLRGTGGPGVTLAVRDPQPKLPLDIAVEVIRDVATDEEPPALRVSITNTSESAIGLGEGRAVVFAYRSSTDNQLTLLPADFDAPTTKGCWRLTDGIAITEEYRTTRIEAGETLTQDLSLYASYDESQADACLPVGEHRFESVYTVFSDPDSMEESEQATWGFSVLLD